MSTPDRDLPQDEFSLPLNEKPSQKVYTNSLIMSNVFSWLSQPEIIPCLAVDRQGFGLAAKMLYKKAPADVGARLSKAFCPLARLPHYIGLVTSIQLVEPVMPIAVPVKQLSEQFPGLREIRFNLPTVGVSGVISRELESCVFSDLHLNYGPAMTDSLDGQLLEPGLGIGGLRPRFRVRRLEVGHTGYEGHMIFYGRGGPYALNYEVEREQIGAYLEGLRAICLVGAYSEWSFLEKALSVGTLLREVRLKVYGYYHDQIVPTIQKHCPSIQMLDIGRTAFHRERCIAPLVQHVAGRSILRSAHLLLNAATFLSSKNRLGVNDVGCMARHQDDDNDDSGDQDQCDYGCYRRLERLDITVNVNGDSLHNPLTFAQELEHRFGRALPIYLEAETMSPNMVAAGKAWAKHVMDIRLFLRNLPEDGAAKPGWRVVAKVDE